MYQGRSLWVGRTRSPMRLWLVASIALALVGLSGSVAAAAVPPVPIPEGPGASELPEFIRFRDNPRSVQIDATEPPRHPFMAPNGKSNIHDDAYMTDTYRWAGPAGGDMERRSSFQGAECATHTFDSRGRVVTICIGADGPRLAMFDPDTLELLAVHPLPPRQGGDPFTDFSGGGYFYLDDRDRAVIPTSNRQLWIVGETAGPGFETERVYDLNSAVTPDDKVFSALPDWDGRIWFVTAEGVVGNVDPESGRIRAIRLREQIANSFAVDETGGVFIVTDAALYRFDADPNGKPEVTWREVYPNSGIKKPGQVSAGSGTTPTLMGRDYVSITDNADPMDVVVYRRPASVEGSRRVCIEPVFKKGESATDNSLIGTNTAMVVENNYGYSGPLATQDGKSVPGGLERVDIDADGSGCRKVWHSDERAPSVVPKLSVKNGLVYTYTKDPRSDGQDAWYLTTLDFANGQTVYKRLGGEGLGYNNHYAPISIAPDGNLFVGTLGGLVLLRDGRRSGP
jgi:hypothetical protein